MEDKKQQQNGEHEKEDAFTGSPEQQLPDLEAEDEQIRKEEQSKEEKDSDQP